MPSLRVSNVDGDTLVAAPSAYQFIRVIGLDLTTPTQTVMGLKSNTTQIWDTNAANNTTGGGLVLNTDANRTIDCLPGQALKLSSSGGGTIKGSIEYVVKGRPDNALAPIG